MDNSDTEYVEEESEYIPPKDLPPTQVITSNNDSHSPLYTIGKYALFLCMGLLFSYLLVLYINRDTNNASSKIEVTPTPQLSEDEKRKNDAEKVQLGAELINAFIRYYTFHKSPPWMITAGIGNGCNGGKPPQGQAVGSSEFKDCISTLVSEGELKSSFADYTSTLDSLFISDTSARTGRVGVYTICFLPQSEQIVKDKTTRYTKEGDENYQCPASDESTCYWCLQ